MVVFGFRVCLLVEAPIFPKKTEQKASRRPPQVLLDLAHAASTACWPQNPEKAAPPVHAPRPPPQVLLDLAHAVEYLHRMSLLHSDIKLENVLLK